MAKRSNAVLEAARASLASPTDYDTFLSKLGAKDRTNITRHVEACEAEISPSHARLWKRMVSTLATLAPHAATSTGQHTVQFFVPDGKYRMQVFAMEDLRDGKLTVYCTGEVDGALREGVLAAGKALPPNTYQIVAAPAGQTLSVESLDAANTPNPGAAYKNMLGWNRKAVRISLPTDSSPQQVEAAENVCALAAQRWVNAVAR